MNIPEIFSGVHGFTGKTMVVYHLHGETGWSVVCANGKQDSHIGNFRLGWRVPFEQQTQLTERA